MKLPIFFLTLSQNMVCTCFDLVLKNRQMNADVTELQLFDVNKSKAKCDSKLVNGKS